MDLMPWPEEFFRKKSGDGCPQCDSGRVDETEHGVRYYAGPVVDAYLQRRGPTPGYSVVIFRGRHVGELHAMASDELASFWTEVAAVAAAIDEVFAPVHLNFQVLGNQDPHVHAHIVPRFDPDPAPSLPLPAVAWNEARSLSADELSDQLLRLRSSRALQRGGPAAHGSGGG